MPSRWLVACQLLYVISNVVAQSVTPVAYNNSTNQNGYATLPLSDADTGGFVTRILPLTSSALGSEVPLGGIRGTAVLASPEFVNQDDLDNLAFISCDSSDYVGMVNAIGVYQLLANRRIRSIIFYSRQNDACQLSNDFSVYTWTYSTTNKTETSALLTKLTQASNNVRLLILPGPSTTSGADPASTSTAPSSIAPGNTTSTTVAMIVLYSITGVITASFLAIIVIGAIRAHRHPERYGPRIMAGRRGQSRAKGLAKAMLDSLPIVKFGDREPPKSIEHELEVGRSTSPATTKDVQILTGKDATIHQQTAEDVPTKEDSISAVKSVPVQSTSTNDQDSPTAQGCSICTDDFEIGQDQRVLPCNHRFHPACVDPWLLNISATCPLCRIDLRPGGQYGDADGSDQDDLAPPLTQDSATTPTDREQVSRRRSLILAVLGVRRPERLTREQRLQALRDYRTHIAEERAQFEGSSGEAGASGSSTIHGFSAQESRI